MPDAATISLPHEIRDALMQIAETYGLSLSELLAEFVSREQRHLSYASERTAVAADIENPIALADYSLWDESASDGIE